MNLLIELYTHMLTGYRSILTVGRSKVRPVYDVARER